MALITSLVSYWALDEASGNAVDAHGLNTLTDTNTVGSVAGKVSGGRNFVAANSEFFTVASNASLQLGDTDFSVQAWIKVTSLGINQTIASKDIDTPATNRDWAFVVNSDDKPNFQLDGSGLGGVSWGSTISTGVWYHICAGHSAALNEVWISVNAGTPVTSATSGAAYSGTSSPFRIGALAYSGFERYFDGVIDEVGLWNRDIRSDVSALYNGGSGVSYADIVGVVATPARIIIQKA